MGVGGKTLVNSCLLAGPSGGCLGDGINNQWLHLDTLGSPTLQHGTVEINSLEYFHLI